MSTKICCKCKKNQDLSLFGKLKSSKDGLRYDCNICRKKYREDNKESIQIQQQNYYNDNKDNLLIKNKEYRINNIETINEQRKEYRNRIEIKEHNKIKAKEYLPIRNLKNKEKRRTNLQYKLSEVYKSKFHKFIKGKKSSIQNILGCNYDFLIKWLECNFKPDMTWENYGTYWDIDHVIPLSLFDFSQEINIKICYNWINLRPLEKKVNIAKSNVIQEIYINEHIKDIQKYLENNTNYEYQSLSEMINWLRVNT